MSCAAQLLLGLSIIVHSCIFALLSDLPPIPDASGFVEVFRKSSLPTNGSPSRIAPDNVTLTVPITMPIRVAYFLHLDDSWAFVSFDVQGLLNNATGAPPTIGLLSSLPYFDADTSGVESHLILHQSITRLNVASSIGSLNVSSSNAGSVEIWPNCYSGNVYFRRPGASGYYDHDDTPSASASNCYGSFQVHNAPDVVLSFCGFAHGANLSTCGTIGNYEGNNSDATHAGNIRSFARRSLQIFVMPSTLSPTPLPTPTPKTFRPTPVPVAPTPAPTPARTPTPEPTTSEASTVAPFTTSVPCECPACSTPADVSIQSTQVHTTAESTTTTATTPLLPCAVPAMDPVVAGIIGGVLGIVATVLIGGGALFVMRKRASSDTTEPVEMKSAASQRSARADTYNALPSTASSFTDDYRSVSSSSNASYGKLPINRPSDPYAAGNLAF
jgi:hypothetical protein